MSNYPLLNVFRVRGQNALPRHTQPSYYNFCCKTNCTFVSMFFCANLNLKLNPFYYILLHNKNISLFQCHFIGVCLVTPISVSPYYEERPTWWQHWQSINLPAGCEGLKRAATSRSLCLLLLLCCPSCPMMTSV